MKLGDIKKKAKGMGIEAGKMDKKGLILAIQAAEGNPQCFDSGKSDCEQTKCCWRGDCISAEKRLF